MAFVDPFGWIHDWHHSLYRGDEAGIDRFLDAIDTAPPSGWTRDREYEQTRLRPDCIRCYLFDPSTDVAVRVWLQRATATRVRGGPIDVIRHPPSGGVARIGQSIAEFADGCVLTAARAAGVRRTRPSFGVRSFISHPAETLFNRFADTADGEWPPEGQAQESWDDLVPGCLAEGVGIDRGELGRWIADSGWEQERVASIADRFFADSESLAKRLAVMASW